MRDTVVYLAILLVLVRAGCSAPNKPHLIYVLVDDWGFADVGFRNPAIKSPTFDELAATGVVLDRHYVFKYCSPSRASLMSGTLAAPRAPVEHRSANSTARASISTSPPCPPS